MISLLKIPSFLNSAFEWITLQPQVRYLRVRENYGHWMNFRDALVRRWTNLNIVKETNRLLQCLVWFDNEYFRSAISTVLFADYPIASSAFALGIVSLLSSLISIGFGVGLIYVLGDVDGRRLHIIATLHPKAFVFALSIPQTWAAISFAAFFACTCVILWESLNQSILVKMGVVLSVLTLLIHVFGFIYLFRRADTGEATTLDG
ncbi:hypothetical protein BDQ12DRAFT_757564 [Crucibulum laeve]|uniref:Uncharacterized protein n=1 Tax=Crucibulum laeve TaxID=68775 RepID=A0A5C3MAW6_9AGAR|nr:hypothetical protein BDQ12DRAFT_757564 [Crucibulum laeve]